MSNLNKEYSGLLVPILDHYSNEISKVKVANPRLKAKIEETLIILRKFDNILTLRDSALSITPYKEFSFSKIAVVSYSLMEEPYISGEEDEYQSLGLQEKAELVATKEYEREQRNKVLNREATSLRETLLNNATRDGLDYLTSFHSIIDDIVDLKEDIETVLPELSRVLNPRYLELRKKYGGQVKFYHIIPETIDWNLYLAVRKEEPLNLETPYWKVIDRVYSLEKEKEARLAAETFLDKRPDTILQIAEGLPPIDDPDLPRSPMMARELIKEAGKRREKLFREKEEEAKRCQ